MLNRKIILLFATGLGVGYLPGPSGTYGTAVAVLLYAALHGLSTPLYLLFLVTFFFFSVWCASFAEQALGETDSGKIVIDEILGYLITMAFLPFRWEYALAGFLAFRLFDITKPFPIRQLERRVKGGLGVVLDDAAAGVLANLVLQVGIRMMGR